MADYDALTRRVDDALRNAQPIAATSCEPREGEAYKCLNCERFIWGRDGCFTEWMKKYGFTQQTDRCPGYKPPENGSFVLTATVLRPEDITKK